MKNLFFLFKWTFLRVCLNIFIFNILYMPELAFVGFSGKLICNLVTASVKEWMSSNLFSFKSWDYFVPGSNCCVFQTWDFVYLAFFLKVYPLTQTSWTKLTDVDLLNRKTNRMWGLSFYLLLEVESYSTRKTSIKQLYAEIEMQCKTNFVPGITCMYCRVIANAWTNVLYFLNTCSKLLNRKWLMFNKRTADAVD